MPTDIERTRWNAWVSRQISKATSLAEKLYWKGMYV